VRSRRVRSFDAGFLSLSLERTRSFDMVANEAYCFRSGVLDSGDSHASWLGENKNELWLHRRYFGESS
jgi:hypothetical protein